MAKHQYNFLMLTETFSITDNQVQLTLVLRYNFLLHLQVNLLNTITRTVKN